MSRKLCSVKDCQHRPTHGGLKGIDCPMLFCHTHWWMLPMAIRALSITEKGLRTAIEWHEEEARAGRSPPPAGGKPSASTRGVG